jgi:O-antigen/teichoic acid export membrane protein
LLLVKGNALKYRILTSTYFILNTRFTLFNLLILKTGLIGIFKAQLIANLLMAVYYIYNTFTNKSVKFNKKMSLNLIFFGFPILLYTLTGMLIEQSSKILIERFLSLRDLGIYNLAFQFSSIIVILNSAINMAWVPIYFKESKINENSNLFRLFSKYLFILISFFALLIAIFQKYVLLYLLNKSYENAEIYIPILVYVFVLTNTYWILLINPIFYSNQIKLLPIIAVLCGALSIASCYLLIPMMGLFGAIISVFLGNLFMNFITYLVIKRKMTLRYENNKLISIVSISFLLFLISTQLNNSNIFYEIILKLFIIIVFILVIIFLKIFNLKEFKLLIKNI